MFDIILVCGIIVAFLVLIASEKFRVDLVAILLMAILMVIGLFRENFASPHEGLSGFRNEATATIAAMFVLSAGLRKTGAINWVSQRLALLGGSSEMRSFILLMTPKSVNGNCDVPMPFSRVEMAGLLGLSEETVCRSMAMMKRAGAIYAPRGHVEIRDWDRLHEIADECYGGQRIN